MNNADLRNLLDHIDVLLYQKQCVRIKTGLGDLIVLPKTFSKIVLCCLYLLIVMLDQGKSSTDSPHANSNSGHTERTHRADKQSGHTERTHRTDTQNGHTERTHRADTQNGHTERTHRADTQSGYTERTHRADTQNGHRERTHREDTFTD